MPDHAGSGPSSSATFLCAVCGEVATTITLVGPGRADPRLDPEPPGVPGGVGSIFSSVFPDAAMVAIAGGPVSVSMGPSSTERVGLALAGGDPLALWAIDKEYAPFWCPFCGASYCGRHYRSWDVYDDGFFDCVQGVCPKGHERMLMD